MFRNIQVLRAVAALLVIIVHCEPVLEPAGIPHHALAAAGVGVDLFFVISGFIMAHTAAVGTPTPRTFMLNRVIRLVPLYWLLTALVFGLSAAAPDLFQSTRASSLDLLRSLFFIPYERNDGTIRPMLFVGWSLNYEMLFYIIFAGSLTARTNFSRICAGAFVILALVLYGAIANPQQAAVKFFTRPIMLEFVLGMFIALIFQQLPRSRQAAQFAVGVAALSLFILPLTTYIPLHGLPAPGIAAALLVAAALVMERGGLVVRSALLILLGDASYSLYLIHPFVSQIFVKLAKIGGLLTLKSSLPITIAIYTISCLAAVFLFRLFERPICVLLRQLAGVPRQVPPPKGI